MRSAIACAASPVNPASKRLKIMRKLMASDTNISCNRAGPSPSLISGSARLGSSPNGESGLQMKINTWNGQVGWEPKCQTSYRTSWHANRRCQRKKQSEVMSNVRWWVPPNGAFLWGRKTVDDATSDFFNFVASLDSGRFTVLNVSVPH